MRNILSKILTLGVIAAPILIGVSLIKNTSNISSSKSNLTITSKTIPPVPTDGVITSEFVTQLIAYKKSEILPGNWNGSLLASDFTTTTSIADGAFQSNTEIKSITLPTTVTWIWLDAFNGASNLTTISALDATSIGTNAFVGTTSIIPSGIKLTGSANINIKQATTWGTTAEQLDITPDVPPTPPSDDQNMIYIIIGAIIGLLLLIAGIVAGVLIYRKKVNEFDSSKNKSKDKDSKEKKRKNLKKIKILKIKKRKNQKKTRILKIKKKKNQKKIKILKIKKKKNLLIMMKMINLLLKLTTKNLITIK